MRQKLDLRTGTAQLGYGTGIGELDAVICKHRMDFVGHQVDQTLEEIRRDPPCRPVMQLDKDKLRRSVNGNEHMQLALRGSDFGDVDTKVADGI